MWVWTFVYVCKCMWRSEDNFQESVRGHRAWKQALTILLTLTWNFICSRTEWKFRLKNDCITNWWNGQITIIIWNRVSLWSSGWPLTQRGPSASAFQTLGSKLAPSCPANKLFWNQETVITEEMSVRSIHSLRQRRAFWRWRPGSDCQRLHWSEQLLSGTRLPLEDTHGACGGLDDS